MGEKPHSDVVVGSHLALSLIHEGAVLWVGEGPGGARVIKVSERVNVRSGSNSDLFLNQSKRRLRHEAACTLALLGAFAIFTLKSQETARRKRCSCCRCRRKE